MTSEIQRRLACVHKFQSQCFLASFKFCYMFVMPLSFAIGFSYLLGQKFPSSVKTIFIISLVARKWLM